MDFQQPAKGGTKAEDIRRIDGEHEIDCKVDGVPMASKMCFSGKSASATGLRPAPHLGLQVPVTPRSVGSSMAQILIYSRREHLAGRRQAISDVLHGCVCAALALPADKRFHRFIALEAEDFIHPADRSERYTIVELSMFEGRSVETKKQLIRSIFERFERELGIARQDVEITIHETPKHNWGIRGLPGDELALSYKVEK